MNTPRNTLQMFKVLIVLFCANFSTNTLIAATHIDETNSIIFYYDATASIDDKNLPITFLSGAEASVNNEIIVYATKPLDSGLFLSNYTTTSFKFAKNFYKVSFNTAMEALDEMGTIQSNSSVLFAQPNYRFAIESRSLNIRDEPYFGFQWHLHNTGQRSGTPGEDIGALTAWNRTKGNAAVTIAVFDGGFESSHSDLKNQWHTNFSEIPGNNIDDDNNGLKDDYQGWNFAINSSNLIYGSSPNHGTAVAGIVGAEANGNGVVGVCPRCKVLPIVISAETEDIVEAFAYASQQNVHIITNSWGFGIGTPKTQALEEAIKVAAIEGRAGKGTTILFAQNNADIDACRDTYPDISAHPNVIAVSSADHHGVKVPQSAYGSCLKILGPTSDEGGEGLATTDRTGDKGYNTSADTRNFANKAFHNNFFGTSAATPVVAGAFGLLYSLDPHLSAEDAEHIILENAAKVSPDLAEYDELTGRSFKYGFGRVDLRFLTDY